MDTQRDFNKVIRFISQNRRRCHAGKNHIETMSFYEPQISLFQINTFARKHTMSWASQCIAHTQYMFRSEKYISPSEIDNIRH